MISIITPAYNAEKFISETIESVISQTYKNWELIIVDDGSTDNTIRSVSKYCKEDSRIKYFHQQNSRQGKARNLAIQHSTGEYLAFLDADDLWESKKLELQLEIIKQKNVDLVFSDIWFFTKEKDYQQRLNTTPGFYQGEEAIRTFLQENRIPTLTVLAKKKSLASVNNFTEKLLLQNAEDYHLWLRLLIKGCSFYGVDAPLAHYRIHTASATGEDKIPTLQILYALEDLHKTYPTYSKQIEYSILKNIYDLLYHRSLPEWEKLQKWIELFYYYTEQTPRINFWKLMYTKMGKRFFRSTFLKFYAKNFSNHSLL